MRQFLKGCKAPELFLADIPVWDSDAGVQSTTKLSFVPIPEMMKFLLENDADFEAMLKVPDDMPELAKVLRTAEITHGIAGCGALGLHADGVPYLKKRVARDFLVELPRAP